MKKNIKNFLSNEGSKADVLIGSLAIVSLVLGSDLFLPFMPGLVAMLVIGIFVAIFAVFTLLIWRERPRDEREAHIVMASDRLGFLAGSIVLSIGVVIQALRHQPTSFLIIALVVMILAKLAGKHLHK